MSKKKSINDLKTNKKFDQLIILTKNRIPYHAAIFLYDKGIFDLSLLGSKITEKIKDYNFFKCKCDFYKIEPKRRNKLIIFLKKPVLLSSKIIKNKKFSISWFLKAESANYILKFRKKRSKKINDMNCIEWIIYGLEMGGFKIPNNVLTADKLKVWANLKLKKIEKKNNLKNFQKYY